MRLTPHIEQILAENPKARDSDKELILAVCQILGADLTPRQLEVLHRVNFESIRRTRQKLQEQGKFMPSPEVAKQRRLKSYIVQQNAPIAKPERLETLVAEQPKAVSWLEDDEVIDV